MKKQNRKQGFTLVELLVVIAILAILATVSIVGYTAFIKKAHESNALAEANQIKEVIRAELIAGNDFVIDEKIENSETGVEPATTTTTKYIITLNTDNKYVVKKIVVTNGTESTNEVVAVETPLTDYFKTLNDKDLAELFAGGNTITVGENGLSLIYNYTESDNNIKVVIDLTADTATIQR